MPLHLNQLLTEGFHLSLKRFFPGALLILHDERAACGHSGGGKHVSALSVCLLNIIQLKGERFKGADILGRNGRGKTVSRVALG